MKPTDITKRHVIATYVNPARLRGEQSFQIKVGNIQKELGWTNRTPSVFSTLSSKEFQDEAGVELIEKRGGPPSGGPSTTWQFVYRVLQTDGGKQVTPIKDSKTLKSGSLLGLYGVLSEAFEQLGGGEAYLQSERSAWLSDSRTKSQDKKLAVK